MRIWPTKRRWKQLGIGVASIVAIALIANGFMAWWVDHKLQTRIAAIRAAGDPASIADLAPKPIPADQNAAAILERLAPRLDEFAKDHAQFLDRTPLGKAYEAGRKRGEPPTPEQINAIRAILDKCPDIDAGLADAAACEKYASLTNYTLEQPEFLDQLLKGQILEFRTAARFLGWRADVLRADGSSEEAARRGIELLQLARLYDHEPSIVNMLVTLAVRGIAVESLYDTLASSQVSPETHAALEAELALHENPRRMTWALKSERAFAIDNHMRLPRDAPQPPKWVFHMFGWPLKSFWIGVLDYFDEEIAAVERPWSEGHTRVGRRQLPKDTSGHGVLADLMIPATQAAYAANERLTASLRALRIFNALTQYRDEHGREATGLEDLSLPKEATIDPFSGEPLKLNRSEDGWIIYSVMQNGVDDGGDFKDFKDYGLAPRKWRAAQ